MNNKLLNYKSHNLQHKKKENNNQNKIKLTCNVNRNINDNRNYKNQNKQKLIYKMVDIHYLWVNNNLKKISKSKLKH